MTEVILAGTDTSHEKRLREALEGVLSNGDVCSWNGDVTGPESAHLMLAERPTVVVLGPKLGTETALEIARVIDDNDPTVTTVLVAELDPKLLQAAISAGVRGVLPVKAKRGEIRETLQEVLDAGMRRRGLAAADGAAPGQRFVTVVSAKGGAGKTVVSSNLAAALAGPGAQRTVLVDLDLQFGDAATALLLAPTYSIVDAAAAVRKDLDPAALKVFLTRHVETGLFVLCAPEDPVAFEDLKPDDISRVLDVLSTNFRHVVVDTDPGLSEPALLSLERSTDVVVVVDLDVPSVRGARKLVEALDALGMKELRRHVILNRADSKVGLSVSDVAESLGLPVDLELPSTRQIPISMNEGRPVVLSQPRSRYAKQMETLMHRFAPATTRRGKQ